jgi:hypothetical protein
MSVRKRLLRFNAEAIDRLADRPGAGPKPRITQDERSTIIALLSKDPPGKLFTEPGGPLQQRTRDEGCLLDAGRFSRGRQRDRHRGRPQSQLRRILLAEGVRSGAGAGRGPRVRTRSSSQKIESASMSSVL